MRRVNDQFLVGVTGVFLDHKNRILLVKHSYRDNGFWSLPGGYLKGGEHPKEGLEREVKEETGYEVSADYRLKIRTDRSSSRLDLTYSGEFFGGILTKSKEIVAAKMFPFEELPLLPDNQILFIERALRLKKRESF